MRPAIVLFFIAFSTMAAAQSAPPKGGNAPLLQIQPRNQAPNPSALIPRLRECLSIEDMTKERLNCYDEIVLPEPKTKPPPAKIVTDCRFLKEEDERLKCFNRFLEKPLQRSAPSAGPVILPKPSLPSAVPSSTVKQTYVKRGRGGCGSRGGAGYRLPNGKCASRR